MSNLNWLSTTVTRSTSALPTSGYAFGMLPCAATTGFAGLPMRGRHVDAHILAMTGRRTWSPPIT